MSKSKGNVVTPMNVLDEYGADAVRYWAANGRPGADTAFEVQQMRVGRRLAVKLLNASKFVFSDLPPAGEVTHDLDRAVLARMGDVVDGATEAFEAYDYTRALDSTETCFWWFCDYYLELVKGRRYDEARGEGAQSASCTLQLAMSAFQRLFAPFLPFACEEVWSWWREGSIHLSPWPDAGELRSAAGSNAADGLALTAISDVLGEIRKAKSQARQPMRALVTRATVYDAAERLNAISIGLDELRAAGRIAVLDRVEADDFRVDVEMEPDEA
jgi:valyl-tRNA synthetase